MPYLLIPHADPDERKAKKGVTESANFTASVSDYKLHIPSYQFTPKKDLQ